MKDFILLAPKTATQYQDMFWRIVEGQIFIGINYPTLFEGEGGDVPALSNWLNEAMKKFRKLTEEQKERRSRIVDITCSFNPYDEYEDINEYVEEVED